jgi:hypothetical protein
MCSENTAERQYTAKLTALELEAMQTPNRLQKKQ